VYDTNMEEKEKQRREKRFPSPCVPSMHNYNAITKKKQLLQYNHIKTE